MSIALPYRFDTSSVWRTILKGAIAFDAAIVVCLLGAMLAQRWSAAIGLAVVLLLALPFTRLLVRWQTGSVGVLSTDRIVIEPNVLLGITLPGPSGTYAIDRFAAVRIEFHMGPVDPGVQGGPNELVWLVGKSGTPDVVVARTENGAGGALGQELGTLLRLPTEEVGAPKKIRL